jgi:dolichol-phosphate mannosyltransferase
MMLSVVIPAHNEQGSIASTVASIVTRLDAEGIAHEVVCVDDSSTDGTLAVIERLADQDPRIVALRSPLPNGFGFAVRAGLQAYRGDAVAIMMADGSDCPDDLIAYWRLLQAGYDCAFGSRFIAGSRVTDYPLFKRVLNRAANAGIRILFGHGYNDTTNAFKAYRREVIDNVQPLLSHHFNLTVEIPLKAIVRGHSYAIVPISWRNRKSGTSKLHVQEMGSRYAYIVLSVFLEHHLTRGDYHLRGRRVERHHWAAGHPAARFNLPPQAAPRDNGSSTAGNVRAARDA